MTELYADSLKPEGNLEEMVRTGAVDRDGICRDTACCFFTLAVKSGGGKLLRRRNFNFPAEEEFPTKMCVIIWLWSPA